MEIFYDHGTPSFAGRISDAIGSIGAGARRGYEAIIALFNTRPNNDGESLANVTANAYLQNPPEVIVNDSKEPNPERDKRNDN